MKKKHTIKLKFYRGSLYMDNACLEIMTHPSAYMKSDKDAYTMKPKRHKVKD